MVTSGSSAQYVRLGGPHYTIIARRQIDRRLRTVVKQHHRQMLPSDGVTAQRLKAARDVAEAYSSIALLSAIHAAMRVAQAQVGLIE